MSLPRIESVEVFCPLHKFLPSAVQLFNTGLDNHASIACFNSGRDLKCKCSKARSVNDGLGARKSGIAAPYDIACMKTSASLAGPNSPISHFSSRLMPSACLSRSSSENREMAVRRRRIETQAR
jgi:hypothetical protein